MAANKLAQCTWDELLAQLQPVQADGVMTVALNHLVPTKEQLKLEPEMMWNMLGGLEGLLRMRQNGRILVALAAYVERWNYDDGVIIAERMRRDGLLLKRSVFRVMVETFMGRRTIRIPFYLLEAASSYYLMKQRLLALYESNQAGLYPRLAEAL
ncbi:MAG TPA: hypothetical protein VK627_05910 [Edaphobacter sp.]|nr:hypothetical protein [Edaphobacter sp.]